LDGFARARVYALAGGALGHSKLAESRDRDLAAAAQGVLDGGDDGVDRTSRVGLRQRGAICDLLDKLRLLHVVLLVLDCEADANTARGRRARNNARMGVTRIAWLVTVLVSLLTALLLLLAGYNGYAGLGLAVAASAAINLT
jgi:hypothetical protein